MSSPGVVRRLNAKVAAALRSMPAEEPDDPPERIKGGLMSMGEVDEYESGEDELFEGDDMSSIAHGELEQHRQLREYARIAAWEMPLLSSESSLFFSRLIHLLSGPIPQFVVFSLPIPSYHNQA